MKNRKTRKSGWVRRRRKRRRKKKKKRDRSTDQRTYKSEERFGDIIDVHTEIENDRAKSRQICRHAEN